MERKLLQILLAMVVVSFAGASTGTLYDVDTVVYTTAFGGALDGTFNGHPVGKFTMTIKNTSQTVTFSDVKILLQWAWVQDWTQQTGTHWFALDYENTLQRWRLDSPGPTYGWVRVEPHDEDGFETMSVIEDIQLTYGSGDYETASVALTDSLPYWDVAASLAPQQSATIDARIIFYQEASPSDPFNVYVRGDVIASTPIPEPGILTLIGIMGLALVRRHK